MPALKAPFPWFGGKSRAAPLIWERFGDVNNYVEPFAGSLAVMLGRQTPPRSETVNDLDCYVANFWRALAADAAAVARWADSPVNEADLHARHLWLVGRAEFRERMKTDPDFFDARIAGWWVWGLSCWIGGGWCALRPASKIPNIDARGDKGVHGVDRKRPVMAADRGGNGVHTVRCQVPRIDAMCDTGANNTEDLATWFEALATRLRRVRVACGDWSRVLGPTPLGLTSNVPRGFRTGVVLDPPYDPDLRDSDLYANDGTTNLSKAVRHWALEHGRESKLRIALCGYAGEHDMPDDWECVAWKANGGYGNRTGNENAHKERIWFSPHCLKPQQGQKEFTL